MAKLNFGGTTENVVTREEFPLAKAQEVLKTETVAVIGYGVQGPGQALNQKDNGINVIVGQRKDSKTGIKRYVMVLYPAKHCLKLKKHCSVVLLYVTC
jgi:ketol-acid reductoisomerase